MKDLLNLFNQQRQTLNASDFAPAMVVQRHHEQHERLRRERFQEPAGVEEGLAEAEHADQHEEGQEQGHHVPEGHDPVGGSGLGLVVW